MKGNKSNQIDFIFENSNWNIYCVPLYYDQCGDKTSCIRQVTFFNSRGKLTNVK